MLSVLDSLAHQHKANPPPPHLEKMGQYLHLSLPPFTAGHIFRKLKYQQNKIMFLLKKQIYTAAGPVKASGGTFAEH
jgi:hypothetical protein